MLQSITLSVETIHNIPIDKERMRVVIETALKAYEERTYLFSEEDIRPEGQLIDSLKRLSVEIGDPNLVLNGLFLITTTAFSQRTDPYFRRIARIEELREYVWLFQPNRVIGAVEEGVDIIKECKKNLRPGGRAANAFDGWEHNCRELQKKYGGDIRLFFESHDNDAVKIIDALTERPRIKTNERKGFRRYGVKLPRLLIQWIYQYDLYPLINADKSLPIDGQIGRIMVQTNGLPIEKPAQVHTATYEVLLPVMEELCEKHNWEPGNVSDALWQIGSIGCSRRMHVNCPLSDLCDRLISWKEYEKGRFSPKDTGRFK